MQNCFAALPRSVLVAVAVTLGAEIKANHNHLWMIYECKFALPVMFNLLLKLGA